MILVSMASLALLIWQMYQLTYLYLKYETQTTLMLSISNMTQQPAISVCFIYCEVLDRKATFKRYPQFSVDGPMNLDNISNIFTVADIFDLTPNIRDYILSCQYRKPGVEHTGMFLGDRQNCSKFMSTTKYFTQLYVCYAFIPNNDQLYYFENVRSSLEQTGLFYSIGINSTPYIESSMMRLAIHPQTDLPRAGNSFPAYVFRLKLLYKHKGAVITKKDEQFFITYSAIIIKKKSYPYSDCQDYAKTAWTSRDACRDACLVSKVFADERVGKKLPFTPLYTEPTLRRIISAKEVESGDGLDKVLYSIEEDCNQVCARDDCEKTIYVTTFIKSTDADKIRIFVYIKDAPNIVAEDVESTLFSTYLVNMLGTFGSWFDISFLTIIIYAEMTGYYLGQLRWV